MILEIVHKERLESLEDREVVSQYLEEARTSVSDETTKDILSILKKKILRSEKNRLDAISLYHHLFVSTEKNVNPQLGHFSEQCKKVKSYFGNKDYFSSRTTKEKKTLSFSEL